MLAIGTILGALFFIIKPHAENFVLETVSGQVASVEIGLEDLKKEQKNFRRSMTEKFTKQRELVNTVHAVTAQRLKHIEETQGRQTTKSDEILRLLYSLTDPYVRERGRVDND